ncbi:MAG: isoprenylcysteine carboxylmethyltransferase family protein [Candidatus Peribacteraceae bacterium]|nr:isoprenylcysteine carboxylmethyltransferase family protein [Candidatus Peribacteraceae bacterium]MDD5075405.1 isoprenylcysteine carboxylmethyltransferase family protein [Candidatus Peribacteraceae bacterium]
MVRTLAQKYRTVVLRTFFKTIATGVIIFLLAGKIDYWQGWVFTIGMLAVAAANAWIFRRRKSLLIERMMPGKGAKGWDLVILMLFGLLTLTELTVGILDTARFRWTNPPVPPVTYACGYFALMIAGILIVWAMLSNNYFSSVVRIQKERGHKVASRGPYASVRHPGYDGVMLSALGLALAFGSLWALIPAVFVCVLFVIRTALEDATLRKELPGYKEYAKHVRYRLVAGMW